MFSTGAPGEVFRPRGRIGLPVFNSEAYLAEALIARSRVRNG
jgi:hypothetical protein